MGENPKLTYANTFYLIESVICKYILLFLFNFHINVILWTEMAASKNENPSLQNWNKIRKQISKLCYFNSINKTTWGLGFVMGHELPLTEVIWCVAGLSQFHSHSHLGSIKRDSRTQAARWGMGLLVQEKVIQSTWPGFLTRLDIPRLYKIRTKCMRWG